MREDYARARRYSDGMKHGRTMRGRMSKLAVPALTMAWALTMLGGCATSSGLGDNTYLSTPDSPKTISLIDTRTGQTIWTVDVPVNRQLVLRFFENQPGNDRNRPDAMRWEIKQLGRSGGELSNLMPVPDKFSRRIDMTLRPVGEYPVGGEPLAAPGSGSGVR